MNAAHLHLLVNHLPLFAALFAGLLIAAGMLRKHEPLTKAGLVLAVVAAAGAFTAARTGEAAEEVVEGIAAVTETAIEAHEEAAEAAVLSAIAFGTVALLALVLPTRMAGAKRAATLGSLVLAVAAFGLVGRAANLGGMIRHTEISSTTPPSWADDALLGDVDGEVDIEGDEGDEGEIVY